MASPNGVEPGIRYLKSAPDMFLAASGEGARKNEVTAVGGETKHSKLAEKHTNANKIIHDNGEPYRKVFLRAQSDVAAHQRVRHHSVRDHELLEMNAFTDLHQQQRKVMRASSEGDAERNLGDVSALERMRMALGAERSFRRNSPTPIKMGNLKVDAGEDTPIKFESSDQSRLTLPIYDLDDLELSQKLLKNIYQLVLVFPSSVDQQSDFYSNHVAPFEGSSRNIHLNTSERSRQLDSVPNTWTATRFAEFLLGMVTESVQVDDANEETVEQSCDNKSESASSEIDRGGSVSHMMKMIHDRTAIDLSKVAFRSPSMLTCNLQAKEILNREMSRFRSRETRIRRAKLKLVAFNAFLTILTNLRDLRETSKSDMSPEMGIVRVIRRRGSSLVKTALRRSWVSDSSPESLDEKKTTDASTKANPKRKHSWINKDTRNLAGAVKKRISRINITRRASPAQFKSQKTWCVCRKQSQVTTTRARPLECVRKAPYAGVTLFIILASIILTVVELLSSSFDMTYDNEFNVEGYSVNISNTSTHYISPNKQAQDDSEMFAISYLDIVNLTFLILFTIDVLLRMIHEGCHDFWFDTLSLVDACIVLLDWLLMLSDKVAAAKFLGSGRLFKGLRLLRILRMAQTTRAAIALQQDFRRPISYRDLFGLEILEHEYHSLYDDLAERLNDWDSRDHENRYRVIVAQAIATRLHRVCGFDVALIQKRKHLCCLVGSGTADLLSEAVKIGYKLQMHNNPFKRSRVEKLFKCADPKEDVVSSIASGRNWLSRKLASDKQHLQKLGGKSLYFDKSEKDQRDLDFASMFRDRVALDPHLSPDTQEMPYRKLISCLRYLEHANFQNYDVHPNTDEPKCIYYSPYAPFVNSSSVRSLFRVYEPSAQRRKLKQASLGTSGEGSDSSNSLSQPTMSLLREVDKIRLMRSIMTRHLNMPWIQETLVVDSYWVHQEADLGEVSKTAFSQHVFFRKKSVRPLLHQLRNYFGESVALASALSWRLGRSFWWPAILGLFVFVTVQTSKNQILSRVFRSLYGVFVVVNSRLFLVSWRRFNDQLNLLWGTHKNTEVDKSRVEFRGITYPDPVTDQMRLWKRDKMAQVLTRVVSWVAVFFMGTVSVLIFLGALYLRETLIHVQVRPEKGSFEELSLRLVSSGIFGLQVVLFEPVFKRVALVLTNWENHRRESTHRSNFVAKAFMFSIINNFTSVFYFSYVEQLLPRDSNHRPDLFHLGVAYKNSTLQEEQNDYSHGSDRLSEISLNLTAVFLTQVLIGNIAEYFIPRIYRCCVRDKPCEIFSKAASAFCRKSSNTKTSTAGAKSSNRDVFKYIFDQQYNMEFDDQESYDNLQSVLVANGYAIVFAVAFPLGGLIACLGLQAELKLDVFQQLYHYRRPFPETAARHSAADRLLDLTSKVAILNNLCLLLFHDFATLKDGQLYLNVFPVVMLCSVTIVVWLLAKQLERCFTQKSKYLPVIQSRFDYRARKLMSGMPDNQGGS